MKAALLLTLCMPLLCLAARPPLSADERSVFHTEHSWNRAYVEADAGKLAEIESDAYVYTEPDGSVHTKADELADAKAGLMNFHEMSLHEASVRITGDTAVVTGRLVVSGGLPGHEFGEILESTDTLVRRGT